MGLRDETPEQPPSERKEYMNYAIYMTKEELVDLLASIRARIETGDSYEGSVEYLMPWDAEAGDPLTDTGAGFRVRAGFRVGNLQGQGGFVMIGSQEPRPQP